MTESTDAGKFKRNRAEALKLARSAAKLIATRGRSVITFDMRKDNPTDDAILAAILGPTGNLRAPTIQVGQTLLVGFNKEAYAALLARRAPQ